MKVDIQQCDFNDQQHCDAVITLLNHYMSGTMGGFLPSHNQEKAKSVINGLKAHPTKLVLLARIENQYVGMTVGFINFSTFSARPFLNIHDVIVLESYRGGGIGKQLMEKNVSLAEDLNCSKITLEVRADNFAAQKLYKNLGFDESKPPMHFWSRYFNSNS